jgi:hypothetical protein
MMEKSNATPGSGDRIIAECVQRGLLVGLNGTVGSLSLSVYVTLESLGE